jgi:uncharacterized integral membrane protein
MKSLKLVAVLLLAALLFSISAVFVSENPTLVDVRFYRWQFAEVSLPLLMIITLSIGLIIGAVMAGMRVVTLKAQLSLTKRQLKLVEKERDKLKLLGPEEACS